MALVNVTNMTVLDNPTCFLNPFQFEITFECLQELEDDLEWKVLYVGSPHDASQDQVLDEILVGPVPVGLNKFVLQADPPDPNKLENDLLGVTVVLVTCSYREREFVRVGYYVNNEYIDPSQPTTTTNVDDPSSIAQQQENGTTEQPLIMPPPPPPPPKDLNLQFVQRQILADKPRVTKFPIPWGNNDEQQQEQQQQNQEHASFYMDDDDDDAEDDENEDFHRQGTKTVTSQNGMAISNNQGTPMTADMDTSMDD